MKNAVQVRDNYVFVIITGTQRSMTMKLCTYCHFVRRKRVIFIYLYSNSNLTQRIYKANLFYIHIYRYLLYFE